MQLIHLIPTINLVRARMRKKQKMQIDAFEEMFAFLVDLNEISTQLTCERFSPQKVTISKTLQERNSNMFNMRVIFQLSRRKKTFLPIPIICNLHLHLHHLHPHPFSISSFPLWVLMKSRGLFLSVVQVQVHVQQNSKRKKRKKGLDSFVALCSYINFY